MAISPDARTASVAGDTAAVYARIALILDSSGQSGLYVTQGSIDNGVITVPTLALPGLTVRAVSITLVRSIEDIASPTPDPAASAFKYL